MRTQIKDSEEGLPCLGPSWGCHSRASTPVSRCETHQDGSTVAHLLDGEWLPRGMGHFMGCGARAFGDCTRLTTGCLGKAPETGKGLDLGDLGMNECGENRQVRGYKRLIPCNQLAVRYTRLATPRLIFLLNLFLTLLLRKGLCSLCTCVYRGLSAEMQLLESDHGWEGLLCPWNECRCVRERASASKERAELAGKKVNGPESQERLQGQKHREVSYWRPGTKICLFSPTPH